jgi:DNA-binding NarL/FixJ family response regulator
MPSSLLASSLVHSTGTIRVAVAHGQRLVRAGLCAMLERDGEIAVVEAASGEEAVAIVRRLRPDVVLMDVHLPGLGCVEATRQILAGPPVAVMVLTASETDARVFATLRAGAAGLLLEDGEPAALVRAVTRLGRGGRLRTTRPRRKQSAREVPMLTPKVTEITRGSAHAPAAIRIKPDAASRQRGEQRWNFAI